MIWRGAALVWLLVIGWCTLRPAPEQAAAIALLKWYCIVCGDSGVADVVLNILLFLPLGIALHALDWPLRRTVLSVLTLSIGIEVFQGAFLVGRDACVGDVMSNTLGGTVGWLGYYGVTPLAYPSIRLARRATIGLLMWMAILWIGTGAALQPALAGLPRWYGQPMHAGRGKQAFPGTLQRATINGIEVPNDLLLTQPNWRDSLAVEIDATRNSAELFDVGAVMLRLVDSTHDVQLGVDQVGDDARLRLRLRGSDWELHNPRWIVDHGMRMDPAVPWRWQWWWRHDRIVVSNTPMSAPTDTSLVVPLSVGLGWAFIHPFTNIIGDSRLLWTGLWLGTWFGLLGWLAAALGMRRCVAAGVLSIATYAGVSFWWGMQLPVTEMALGGAAFVTLACLGVLYQPQRSEAAA